MLLLPGERLSGIHIAKTGNITGELLLANGNFQPIALGVSPSAGLAERFSQQLFGQPRAMDVVAKSIIRAQQGLTDPRQPKASYLFLGPTGVGKTETARVMAEVLGLPFIRVDCTDMQEGSSVTRLKGTEPKFVGYGDPTLLMPDKVNPGAVVVFDEIEKAHSQVWKWLIPVLEEGKTTLFLPTGEKNPNGSLGQKVAPTELNFRNSYIVFTSNEGAEAMQKSRRGGHRIGFSANGVVPSDIEGVALEALRRGSFKSFPEFLGRIGHTIVFDELERGAYARIFDKMVDRIMRSLSTNNPGKVFSFTPTTALKDAVLNHAKTAQYGARDIGRAVKDLIFDAAADYMASGAIGQGNFIVGDWDSNGLVFYKQVSGQDQVAPELSQPVMALA